MTQKKRPAIFFRNNHRLLLQLTFCILFASMLASCSSSKKINTNYIYFRDGADTVLAQQKEITIQPNDLLIIQVSSRTINQEQAAIFNLPATAGAQNQSYQVNADGNINFPVLGNIKAGGLTKSQLQSSLVTKLTDYVKNPTVIVGFAQFNVNVLGEVKTPGTQKFFTDKVSIIDAIGAAGDLTDYGKREDITVIREEGNKRIYHTIDLRKKNLFESEVYFLQPNDIVYVGPSKNRIRTIDADLEKQRKTSLFFSIATLVVGTAALLFAALK